MNILLEQLPTAIEIDGKEYKLNTDYRVGLRIMLAFEDSELTWQEKQIILLNLLYKEVPDDRAKASELGLLFLNCGENSKEENEVPDRVYSFEKDAKYIFTAVKQTHSIDLESIEYLHWWKFCYMFMDLSETCFFSHLIDYRIRRAKGKLTKEEKEYCVRIKDILDLPKNYTAEELEAQDEFMRLLGKG